MITVTCKAITHGQLARSLKQDVLPEVQHNFVFAAVVIEAVSRLQKMDCPAGMVGRRAYDQQC